MSFLRYLIFGCFLLSVSKFADGLECYQCANCNSPFKPEGILKVNSNETNAFCSKTTARNVATTRGILADCKENSVAGFGIWCCNTDLCNGANPTTSSFYLVFTIATIVVTMLF